MRRTRGRSGDALRAAALASVLLAACCPVPTGPPGGGAAAPAGAWDAQARLTVRTSAGPAADDGGLLARTEGGDVVRLVPEDAVVLPPDATLYVAGRWSADGTLRVASATALDAAASAR